MYLIDTNIISELRKKNKADKGVQDFFEKAKNENIRLFISVITIGEIRRGIELIRYRKDMAQADLLESWLEILLQEYSENILDFTSSEAQIWGRLRVPHHENTIDKQIAATALSYGLTLVTRNVSDFNDTTVELLDPFE